MTTRTLPSGLSSTKTSMSEAAMSKGRISEVSSPSRGSLSLAKTVGDPSESGQS